MAVLDDLLQKVEDPILRDRLAKEIRKATKHKKFGLVFEEHLPECTPLYDIPVKKDSKVALRNGKINECLTVLKVDGDNAVCLDKSRHTTETYPVSDLVCVAEFGDSIYPYLQIIDTVCNAPNSDLWHTLIEADNYHALQLLEYLYAGKVDCIYIDPPYNTGARDWKYNNNYVDNNDLYRHSKWLSFMERRLKIAKKLLNPTDSVLIVTIDENEIHHLRCLLEDVFPNAYIQMVTIVINRKGSARLRFARVEEYALYVFIGNATVPTYFKDYLSYGENGSEINITNEDPRWERLLRGGTGSRREDSPTLFYPVYVDPDKKCLIKAGDVLPLTEQPDLSDLDSKKIAWPIRTDGTLGRWQASPDTFNALIEKGYAKLGTWDKSRKTWTVLYLNRGTRKRIDDGEIIITGRDEETGVVSVKFAKPEAKMYAIKTVWFRNSHDSGVYGSTLLRNIVSHDRLFDFPKSLYSTKDAIQAVLRNKKNALVLDFFAGSGTTLHSVNLLNAEDGGNRRCIIVTNNEVSDAEAKELSKKGFKPGDEEWDRLGIARYVTWPRTVCSIEGHDIHGNPLKGDYISDSEISLHMSDGFKSNAIYFKLGFLDKNAVALGRQFKELLAVLWMKAGAIGPCPHLAENDPLPEYMILPENKMAILIDETAYAAFEKDIKTHTDIETLYIVTDSERGFREMAAGLDIKNSYQLYRDYLDNFRINYRR